MKFNNFFKVLFTVIKNNKKMVITTLLFVDLFAGFSYALVSLYSFQTIKYDNSFKQILTLSKIVQDKDANISSLQDQILSVDSQYKDLQGTDPNKLASNLQSQIDQINTAYTNYNNLQTLISQAKSLGINIDSFNTQFSQITTDLLAQKYSDAITAETSLNTSVTNAINAAKQPAPVQSTPAPENLSGSSFNITTVNAQGTNYTVYYIDIDLTSPGLKIITDTGNASDCANNCPVYNLMTYYKNNNGFAAINGTYFCPADYSSCAGKVNSFDFPVYKSNESKWINEANISWVGRAAFTFNGVSPTFYPQSNSYGGGAVTAGIFMSPGLVQNGQVIVQNYSLDSKSLYAISTRGGICTKGHDIIVADAFSLTVPQMAYVMQAMGCTNAMGLDGGGSVAMIYNGQYKLGPGRNLPNALIFAR